MTTTASSTAVTRPPADPLRRTSLAAGILYLLTFVSVPTLALYQDARNDAGFVLGAGSGSGVLLAAGTEVVVAVTCIGTAVVFFPVLRRRSETAAIGFLASRVTEGALIIVGVVSVLTLFTLRTDVAGTADADPASLVTTGHALSAAYDWTFLLSQSLMPVFNALFLGYALYRSGLVPRILPTLGLIGAPLLLASDVAVFFGVYDRAAPIAILAAAPIAVWEFSLGVYLVVRGFRTSAVAALSPAQAVR
ncbi:DUF4386 domain-containing protein [Geodermatophilus normandii]|uniref:DUF4386 domain-containing protein n=1 Tax=Geodermatophilus normandii TaxID=1137989 RepID=A0A6P0GH96_9ACTN|nr:DUF4386 domain-containing protein [Geodermatophilus normandii]NEM06634.1 DUF4386 domain-containing protein [Geodermatophilus normandii]NEM08358.1 DUF4386 domain-containing protein [Geodermatophilus normandii]